MKLRIQRLARLGLTMLVTVCAGQAAAQCIPGPGQVALFVDSQYRGSCVVLPKGDFPTPESIGLPNDSISSVRLGPGAQLYACRDDFFQGTCVRIMASTPNLTNSPLGNDSISSLRVQAVGAQTTCVPGPNQVAFFIDVNFLGGCQVRGFGQYQTPAQIGLPNDSISSIRVGASAQVEVCRDTSYQGHCERFVGDVANLAASTIGNDAVSSAKVQPRGAQDCNPGPLQAAFFVHDNFTGPCSMRTVGQYPNAAALGLPNDSISSVLVGQGAQAILCADASYAGDCVRFTTSNSRLSNSRIGDNRVSSAKVMRAGEYECSAGSGQIALFEHDDLVGPCRVVGIGEYPTAQALGIPNDTTSSILVGGNTQVALCADNDYLGHCQKFTSSSSHLNTTRIGADRVSSARVQPLGTVDCPIVATQVAVYVHIDFLFPCSIREAGDFANAAAIGAPDNSISSIRVGSSVQACACDGEKHKGQCKAFTSDVSDLGSSGWNDRISSLRVTKPGVQCLAVVDEPVGVKAVLVSNCSTEMRSVKIWLLDLSTGLYTAKGEVPSNWSNGSCGATPSPLTVTLPDKHWIRIIAVDPKLDQCGGQDDPRNIRCEKGRTGDWLGGENGTTELFQVF